jgi:hypothetical protein
MTTDSSVTTPAGWTYPALFDAADKASLRGQRDTLRLTAVGLGVLLLGGALGVIQSAFDTGLADVAGVFGAVSFFAAVLIRSYSLTTRPERDWYNGRALAESAKTLSWRYAVGGSPFPAGIPNADETLSQRFLEILRDVNDINLAANTSFTGQITPAMRAVRTLPLNDRRDFYLRERVEDQYQWYARRAESHARRARWFGLLTLVVECAGGGVAIAKVTGVIEVDLLSFFAAVAAALIAWERARQDATLSRAYSLAAQELAIIGGLVQNQATEEDWARFVDHAEEAISREHTLWRASHT